MRSLLRLTLLTLVLLLLLLALELLSRRCLGKERWWLDLHSGDIFHRSVEPKSFHVVDRWWRDGFGDIILFFTCLLMLSRPARMFGTPGWTEMATSLSGNTVGAPALSLRRASLQIAFHLARMAVNACPIPPGQIWN